MAVSNIKINIKFNTCYALFTSLIQNIENRHKSNPFVKAMVITNSRKNKLNIILYYYAIKKQF